MSTPEGLAGAATLDPETLEVRPDTVGGTLVAAARAFPDREALVIAERRASWRALLEEVVETARALVGLGVGRGEPVGILMPNAWEYIVLFHAVTLVGARAVTLNARYRADDLAYVIPNSQVAVLFVGGQALPHTDFRSLLPGILPGLADWDGRSRLALHGAPALRTVVNLADPRERVWPGEARLGALAREVPPGEIAARAAAVSPDDVALVMYSSGTTARPKACMLPHRNLVRVGAAVAERFEMSERDRFWDPLPFFHMSTMLPLAACRASGACFIGEERFDPALALDELERERVTIFYPSFPTITNAILAEPGFRERDLSRIRLMINVGPPDLLRRYCEALPNARLVGTYGLTEATGVIAFSSPDDGFEDRLVTCGRPFPGIEVRIVDPESERPLPAGERGEIRIRGWCRFAGYHGDPDKTAEAFDAEGWLRTGDIASLDEAGRIRYHGRLKDMLKIGGENVAAIEIESFLQTHPDIRLAQVIGVPDEHLFEVAAAFVETEPGARLAEEDVVRYCLGRIASYKIPRHVRFVDAWPMSATKIQKFRLREGFEPGEPFDVRGLLEAMRAPAERTPG